MMNTRFQQMIGTAVIVLVLLGSIWPETAHQPVVHAAGPYTFTGRWGTTHTATWDTTSYQATISAEYNMFPWDFISFVGVRGAISLCGHPNVAGSFAWSTASAIAGVGTGDLLRVKGNDNINLTHVTKIGLVLGSGPTAQRAWVSQGTIIEYVLAPEYVGYRATVLGRELTVRLSQVAAGTRETVGIVEVSIDNPQDARIYFISDLEPAVHSSFALEFHSRSDTQVSYDAASEVITGQSTTGTSATVYMYSDSPLQSWSGSNLDFGTYLQSDTLDEEVLPTASDGRSAIIVEAQSRQYFYIGSAVLSGDERQDPTPMMDELRAARVDALAQLPIIHATDLPALELVSFLSNLFGAYLINPDHNVWYSDRVFIYGADSFMPIMLVPELLPASWLASSADLLGFLGDNRYVIPEHWRYAYKFDVQTRPPLPAWQTGGIPGYVFLRPDGSVDQLGQWSDLYETAQYISSVHHYLQTTADGAFVDTQQAAVLDALAALKRFDTQYDTDYGEDGDRYPNVPMPMSSLAGISGTYPGEGAAAIYGYRAAEVLLRRWGMAAEADDLAANYITPMVAGFDAAFWDAGLGFYTGIADERSTSRTPGTRYQDKWCQAMLPSLMGDLGHSHLADMTATFLASGFYDTGHNVHWLSPDSENWCYPGRWGTSPVWTNGFSMQGGFYDGLTGAAVPLAYYQLDQGALGNQYAQYYLDVWLTQGPYESMYEWNDRLPGRFIETSIYIEPVISTMWLVKEALGLSIDGINVTIAPVLTGEFSVENLHITSMGLTAVVDYWRDAAGLEHVTVHSNEGLNILTPQVLPTAVSLVSFTATGYADHVLISWETVSEVEILGFNLYRTAPDGGSTMQLNDSLIPAQGPGGTLGFVYTYVDTAVAGGQGYSYTLEGVDVHGAGTRYGPISVVPAPVYRRYLPLVLKIG